MQPTNNETKTIHIKVVINNEFRRFCLDSANFGLLEKTIRTVYSLPEDEKLKICFVDDENDLVALSSDEEFLYATDLVRPLRLVVTLGSCAPQAAVSYQPPLQIHCETPTPTPGSGEVGQPSWPRRGRGRGQFRGDKQGWNEEKRKWREENPFTKEQRTQHRVMIISDRIQQIETLLLTDLPAHRERTLSWKLEKLQSKLENLRLTPNVETPVDASHPVPMRGGRGGRGGRGCGRGRKAWHVTEGGEPSEFDQIFETIRNCRKSLRAARESGDADEIERCDKALEEAKVQKWEAKRRARGEEEKKKPFSEEKARKRECMKNLREARTSGDKVKIEECQKAFLEAKEALQKVKCGEC